MENVVQATDDGATAASRTGTHTTAAPPALLSADRPVTDPQDDQLGYAPFARHLAAGLMKMAPLEGFVVAIHGPWGSGKSTLLNFVRAFLTNESENSGNRPVIVLFNPWWFSGTEALTRHFFAQLQAAMDTDTRLAESLRRKLSGLARLIGKLPVPGREFAEVASTLLEPGQLDVVALKEAVADELRASGVRIVVIVDDIDRLLAEEMREISAWSRPSVTSPTSLTSWHSTALMPRRF